MKPVRLFLSPRRNAGLSPAKNSITEKVNHSPIKSPSLFKDNKRSKNLTSKRNLFPTSPNHQRLAVPFLRVEDNEYTEKDKNKTLLELNTPKKSEIGDKGLIKSNLKNLTILGRGCFGTVVKGIEKNFKQPIAVKVIANDVNVKTTNYKLNESNAIGLVHENIVKTYDVSYGNKFSCVVMECVNDAVKLAQVIHNLNQNFGYKDAIKCASDLSRGLQFCHENGILHLDIKPANVVLKKDSTGVFHCKICDFGNSVKKGKEELFVNRGSPAYTAPEIFLGKNPSEKSDVYSFGITLWEMINRKIPYENIENAQILIYKVVKHNLRPDNLMANDINERTMSNCSLLMKLVEQCKKCWANNPMERPTIFEMRKYIEN